MFIDVLFIVLVCLSFDCFFVVYYFLKYKFFMIFRKLKVMIVVVWLVFVIIIVLFFFRCLIWYVKCFYVEFFIYKLCVIVIIGSGIVIIVKVFKSFLSVLDIN